MMEPAMARLLMMRGTWLTECGCRVNPICTITPFAAWNRTFKFLKFPQTFPTHQQREVGVDVMGGGHGVEDEVEGPGGRRHALLAGGHHEAVRADLPGGGLLAGRGGDGRHGVAHGPGQLYAHLTQASDTHHPHPHAALEVVVCC